MIQLGTVVSSFGKLHASIVMGNLNCYSAPTLLISWEYMVYY